MMSRGCLLKGESPMVCAKTLLKCSGLFAIALFAQASFITSAQTTDSKPKATASITGRVTIGEKPASGITVIANVLASPQSLVAQTITDADGKYRLNGLPPAGLTVAAYAPTYVMPNAPTFATGKMVLLSVDETVEGVDFKLIKGGVITGRVTDAEGKPAMVDRVSLTLVDDRGDPARGMPARPPNPFIYGTDDRGIYRIYGLPAGRYKVSADMGGT